MGNWFKKLFGCKCQGGNCGSCCHKEEAKPTTPEVDLEVKPEASQSENVEKSQ